MQASTLPHSLSETSGPSDPRRADADARPSPSTPPRPNGQLSAAQLQASPVTPTVRDPLLQSPPSSLRKAALSFDNIPSIYKRKQPGSRELEQALGIQVVDWDQVKRHKATSTPRRIPKGQTTAVSMNRQSVPKASKHSKAKSSNPGRTYTSKYRGVHQTFPTKRWEAQFRRNGKPTSLGCFDLEAEAARAYDKMMLWCELHQNLGMKGGITNFDPREYERDLEYLTNVSQEELVQSMRSEGRRQATQRIMRAKRDGQMAFALMNRLEMEGSQQRKGVRRALDLEVPAVTDSEGNQAPPEPAPASEASMPLPLPMAMPLPV